MATMGLAPLTMLGLEAVAARVAYTARVENDLNYFEPVAAMPGFARSLARTIAELRLGRVDRRKLAEAGESGADLARLLDRYEAELQSRGLADLARVFSLAMETREHRWLGLPIVRLDAPLDSLAHREFFEFVAARSPAVFQVVLSDQEDDEVVRPPMGELEHLRRYLFSPRAPRSAGNDGAFEIFSAPGEGLEAVEIARRILRLAREGVAFDRIAVLIRNPDRYQPVVEEALRRARIPAYFSRGTTRPDPSGRAFLALVACAAEKCSASRFAEYLSLGQVPPAGFEPRKEWVAPDDELLAEPPEIGREVPVDESPVDEATVPRAPATWEKLLVDAAVIGGRDRWKRRLTGLDREFELRLKTLEREDDTRREHVKRQLDRLRELEKFALPLIDILDALPRSAFWKDWIVELGGLARLALRSPEPVLAVLAEFEPMGDIGPASIEEVMEVLGERLRFLRRDPPQRRYGHVFIGSIDEARGREFGVVFLPGLAEGLFPQRAFEDPLLLDDLKRAVEKTLPVRDTRVEEERMRLRLAVASARDRLIASYPRMDLGESRPRVPSFYALELPRAIEGKLPELRAFEQSARDKAQARLNWPAPAEAVDAIDETEYDLVTLKAAERARYLVEVNDALARSLRGRWKRWAPKWTEADGLITSDNAALAALAKHRLMARAWSPSSLQNFAACPYKFALHGIYGLRPREEAAPIEQLDPLTRGALFHEVQFAVLTALKASGALPVNQANLEDALHIADTELNHVAEKYEEDLAPAIPRVWTSQIEDLRTDLRGWLQHIAANDDDWEPVHFEFAFGLTHDEARDPSSTDQEADLDVVRLRGSIDLVERHASLNGGRGVFRVTDHKTGKPPEMIPAFVGGGKFLQPLLYALAAEKLLGASVESGRLFYATQQGGYQHALIPVNDRSRQFLTKLLGNIDAAITAGFLPPVPQKGACEICDYRAACGPYEELRTSSSYKNVRDERLEALIEIRAMA
jgi:CRISPR/Cas system-associated exonuclease Cas4 (RecB family)